MKHYQTAIKLDDFLVAEFDYSVILHHVFSDKVLLVSSSVLSALQKLEQNVLYSVDLLTPLRVCLNRLCLSQIVVVMI